MKCHTCKKNLLVEYNCKKCKWNFCITHRLPEKHCCPNYEDYRNDKIILEKVVAKKISNI